MRAFNRLTQGAVLAAVAASALAAAGSASAEVQMARSECIDGYWHVRTYDITNPDNWILIEDRMTWQPCGEPRERLSVDVRYRIEPRYEIRPQLRYHIEEREAPRQQHHVSMRYKF
jgi:hypothetical protein